MVSNGDNKALNFVENMYGEHKVEKLDCAGHVQKLLGKSQGKNKRKTY